MSKRAFSAEYRFEILKVYEEGNHSINEIASTYKVASSNKVRFVIYMMDPLSAMLWGIQIIISLCLRFSTKPLMNISVFIITIAYKND